MVLGPDLGLVFLWLPPCPPGAFVFSNAPSFKAQHFVVVYSLDEAFRTVPGTVPGTSGCSVSRLTGGAEEGCCSATEGPRVYVTSVCLCIAHIPLPSCLFTSHWL